MANLNFKLTLTAVDKISAPVKAIQASMKGVTSAATAATAPARALSKAVGDIGRATRPTNTGLDMLKRAASSALSPLRRLEDGLERLSRSKAGHHFGRMAASLRSIPTALAGAAGITGGLSIAGLMGFGKSVVDTGAEFEGYRELLTVLHGGSTSDAKASLDWITAFAERTPAQLSDVMKAFVKLKNFQFDPTNGLMESLGNAAAVWEPLGKSLDDLVEALGDAAHGEFERLKEFGIVARQSGKLVTLSLGDMKVTTEKTARGIEGALRKLFDAKYSGAMERQAKGFRGLMSMALDAWQKFKKAVADAGVFDWVKGQLTELLALIDKASKNGDLAKWAKAISDALIEMFKAFKNLSTTIDWPQLINSLATVADSLALIAKGFNAISEGADRQSRFMERIGMGWALLPSQRARARQQLDEQRNGGRLMAPPVATAPSLRMNGPYAPGRGPAAPTLNGTITVRTDAGTRAKVDLFSNTDLNFRTDRGLMFGGF